MPARRVPLYPDGDGYPSKRVSFPDRALGRALRQFRPDVVHAVNPVLLAAGGVGWARRNRVPLVASYHAHVPSYAAQYGIGVFERFGWRYIRTLHNLADVNLCTSMATMELLVDLGIERLNLWPYGVDQALLQLPAASGHWRSRLSCGHPERPILLFVGRLAKEKHVETLLPAARQLDGCSLAIVGDGPQRSSLEREFAGTNTTFLGILTGPDLLGAYASADVFVFPSTTETLGLVLLEAHAAGLPVVAADSTTSRELVRHGVDGLLFEHCDSASLIGSLARLLADQPMRQAMGLEGRRAVSGATWGEATRVLHDYYEQVTLRRLIPIRADGAHTRLAGSRE
jgi:glycosyltransferase involved in cell wall biosynthesis